MHAGMRLLTVMEYLKLTQVELAELINSTQASVSRKTQKEAFSKSEVAKMAPLEAKGINIQYFLQNDEPMLLRDRVLELREANKKVKELQGKLKTLEKELEECRKGAKTN